MTLGPGITLGPYSVTAKIGDGGIGEVRPTLVALCLVVLVLLAASTEAQVAPQSPTAAAWDGGAGSTRSLQRIRRALATTPSGGLLNLSEHVYVIAEAPEEQSLFGDFDLVNGPVPYGPPTHYDMHGVAPPMSAFYSERVEEVVFAPFRWVGKAIVSLFTGEDDPGPAVEPLLSQVAREQAVAQIQGHANVLAADIEQRGRTVALALVVPATTPVATARQLGDDFVRMVTTLAPSALGPDADSRAADYDYLIGVRTSNEVEIAVGGRPAASSRIAW
ncbi:MAG: hypothetical protein QF681_12350 [Vicinamibacterales bacterium]|nr:hypothetical protein [Vicinamibacterales bacterium]